MANAQETNLPTSIQPCTVRDFMNYAEFIEHCAEDLKFLLWLRDYTKHFTSIKDAEKAVPPERTEAQNKTPLRQSLSSP